MENTQGKQISTSNVKPNLGFFDNGAHYYPVHVFYNHTDAGQIVYFANYLRMTEEARVAMFYLLGNTDAAGYNEIKFTGDFVVRSCQADYFKSAILNDDLVVVSKVSEVGKVHIILTQDIYRDSELLVSVKFKLVFVRVCSCGAHKPTRVPEFWLDKIQNLTENK